MSFDLIIKNGTVILENEARVVDIAVKDGKIAAIGQDLGDPLGGIVLLCNYEMHSIKPDIAVDLSFSVKIAAEIDRHNCSTGIFNMII